MNLLILFLYNYDGKNLHVVDGKIYNLFFNPLTLEKIFVNTEFCCDFQVQAVYNAMRRDDRMKYFL